MKKRILTLMIATAIISLTGCPNNEVQEENIDTPPVENYVNTTNEEVVPMNPNPEQEKTESVDPSKIITPEDEPYEWVEPEEEYVCEENPEPIPAPFTPGMGYDAKPVIYLYPEETAEITVKLDYNGTFTTTYPAYNDGWQVTAEPDGTLKYNGREYYCLFWEGVSNVNYSLEKGFCVKGKDTEKFLEESLEKLGLTDKEANEFIIFWLPQMENNEYNIISFQDELYTDNAELTISPEPDTIIRVFMAWKGADEFVEIQPQEILSPERIGFTVVEWGGSELK